MAQLGKSDIIIQAALDVISERGFHNAPSSLIAKRAGVAEGTIYRYFRTKDELIHSISSYIIREFYEAIMKGYSSEKPLRVRFFHICKASLRYFIKYPRILRFADQFSMSPYRTTKAVHKIHSELDMKDALLEVIKEGVSQQVFKDIPIPTLNALTISSLRSLARSHSAGNKLDDTSIDRAIEVCWDAIKRSD